VNRICGESVFIARAYTTHPHPPPSQRASGHPERTRVRYWSIANDSHPALGYTPKAEGEIAMNPLRVCILILVFAVIAARAEETNTPTTAGATSNAVPSGVTSNVAPSTITIDGTTYQDVRWGRLTPSTVTIFHRTGIATMPLWKLPPDLQKQFSYDAEKATAFQDAQRKAAGRAAVQARLQYLRKIDGVIYDFSPAETARRQWQQYLDGHAPTDAGLPVESERLRLYNAQIGFDDYRLIGTVIQILDNGLLVGRYIGNDKYPTYLKHYSGEHSAVDGDLIRCEGMDTGRYKYTDVSGAQRTVPMFDCGEPLEESDFTAKIISIAPHPQ